MVVTEVAQLVAHVLVVVDAEVLVIVRRFDFGTHAAHFLYNNTSRVLVLIVVDMYQANKHEHSSHIRSLSCLLLLFVLCVCVCLLL